MHKGFIIVAMLLVVIVTSFFSGAVEYWKPEKATDKKERSFTKMLLFGGAKVMASIGIALLVTIIVAAALSVRIKPNLENVMPAFRQNESFYDWRYVTSEEIPTIISESEVQIDIMPEIAYMDLAHAYFFSKNYDKAIPMLEKAYELNPDWTYLNDIGICYAYLRNYAKSLEYLELALEMDPPVVERGILLEAKSMIEDYYGMWVLSLIR